MYAVTYLTAIETLRISANPIKNLPKELLKLEDKELLNKLRELEIGLMIIYIVCVCVCVSVRILILSL